MTVPVSDSLFQNDTPLLDVRAPVEFARGAFPTAVNLPILDDTERQKVGIAYRHEGPEAATALGHRLVSGDVRDARVAAWVALYEANPDLHLYCFRGGQRSAIAAQWLREAGIEIPRIEGGYKAMRTRLLGVFDALPRLIVVGGKTGVGKTGFLSRLPENAVVDLEQRANHRGSAFGKQLTPQPAQIDFENAVAIDFLKAGRAVCVEDESRMIGACNLPLPLQEAMKQAPVLVVEDSVANRVERILEEYVVEAQHALACAHNDPDAAPSMLHERLRSALDAIRKRLGGDRHREIGDDLSAAFEAHGDDALARHRVWIEKLLVNYYDPMYDYQLERKAGRIAARGDADEMVDLARTMILQMEQGHHE